MPYTTIDRGSDYFRVKTYTGTGSSQSVTFNETPNMQPDFTWIKDRSNARDHQLVNAVVGYSNGTLLSNTTDAEYTAFPRVDSRDANGFTVSTPTQVNGSGETYCSWNWKANGAGVSNTAGTISSTVSANTTSGFSVVNWTGSTSSSAQTVGHGLGVTPKMIILKNRDSVDNWFVYHASVTNTSQNLYLNTTASLTTQGSALWGAGMTSTLVGVRPATFCATTNDDVIMYCFAEVKGFSKAFSYTGNGSTDGTYVNLGFRPAWVLIKCSSNAGDGWFLFDNKRTTYNVMSQFLFANSSASEETNTNRNIDFLSNGIKLRNSDTSLNFSGYTYVGFAIAENPFVSSKGIPCTAR